MGFLGGLTQTLFGGSQSSGSNQSGFSLLPQSIQNAYTSYGTQVGNQVNNPNLTSMYTPIGQTAGETQAYNAINQGFTPTASSLNSDLSMLMNPYNDSVIGNLNRQANSQDSVLRQNTTQAGQFGSNRQMLGASDIENQRQLNIGSLLQGQYNTALGQVFNNLVPQRAADAAAQLGAGANQRQLALQTSTAPITGLQQIGAALGILPTSGGSTGTQQSTASNGIFSGA